MFSSYGYMPVASVYHWSVIYAHCLRLHWYSPMYVIGWMYMRSAYSVVLPVTGLYVYISEC